MQTNTTFFGLHIGLDTDYVSDQCPDLKRPSICFPTELLAALLLRFLGAHFNCENIALSPVEHSVGGGSEH